MIKILKVAALALCLSSPMTHANDPSVLRALAMATVRTSCIVGGAMTLAKYEDWVAPRSKPPASAEEAFERIGQNRKEGLSFPHQIMACAAVAIPLSMAMNAAESALDALNKKASFIGSLFISQFFVTLLALKTITVMLLKGFIHEIITNNRTRILITCPIFIYHGQSMHASDLSNYTYRRINWNPIIDGIRWSI